MANALLLLSEYASSSSEDEAVPGPRVSTKRCTPKDWCDEQKTKKKTLLPVPSVLTTLFADNRVQHSDDPSQHDGRIRSYQHERGNWTTFVFIPYDNSNHAHLSALVKAIITEFAMTAQLKIIENVHISLTKTVVLQHHWIEPFIKSVQSSLTNTTQFTLCFDSLEVYTNDEKTRTFIGLRISDLRSLVNLVGMMDKCLAEFKLPEFYKNPSFHLSFAWCLGDCENVLRELLPKAHVVLDRFISLHPTLLYLSVPRIMCKSGNKIFEFKLISNTIR